MDVRREVVEAAYAQPLTEELLDAAGIRQGMRVVVLGRRLAEVALLVAERVGPQGQVIAACQDATIVAQAQFCAALEGIEQISFHVDRLSAIRLGDRVDAVFGRFLLTHEHDPVQLIRSAAAMVHEGGRIIFQEWHYDSVRWEQTSGWPHLSLYDDFARWSIEGLQRQRVHVDMGLRLVNAFAAAGLPLPAVRTDLRMVHGGASLGYAFFEATIRDVLPTIEGCGLANAREVDIDTFAQRLERETTAAGGHLFLPLQVGAWSQLV